MTDPVARRVMRRVEAMRARLAHRRRLLEDDDGRIDESGPPADRDDGTGSRSGNGGAALAAQGPASTTRVDGRRRPSAKEAPNPVPFAVRAASDWSWRFLVIVLAVALIGWLAWQLRIVVFPVAVAVLLAALLHPAVRWLRAKGFGRGLAAATTFIGFLIVLFGSLTLVGGAVSGQFGAVIERAGEGLVEIQEWFEGPPFHLTEEQVGEWVDRIAGAVGQSEEAITEGAVTTATAAIEFLTGMVLAFFALLLFLYDGDRIWGWMVRLFPQRARNRADGAGRQAWLTLTSYIRGQTLVALFDGFFITILLLILGVPLALPLGVLVFFGAYVPLVGAIVTGALAVLVALVANGFVTALIVLAGIIAIQQIESNVFAPLVLGRMARIHPLAVVLAITIGVITAGILGGIIAVPVVAIANSVGKYLANAPAEP